MARDDVWLRSLHSRAAEDVTRYALRRAPSVADAEDAVSEAFLVAWRRREVVPDPPEDILWLYGVTRNALANQSRGDRRRIRLRARLATEPAHLPGPDPPDPRVGLLREALVQLPEDAELLRLLTWERLSHGQAAEVLGTSENAVALRASRARRRLAQLMTASTAVGT